MAPPRLSSETRSARALTARYPNARLLADSRWLIWLTRFQSRTDAAATIEVDLADLENFFKANLERYRQPAAEEGQEPQTPTFDQARPMVERDYRLMKIEQAYNETIASELSTEDVELYPERMVDGG